jgi:hypothetical protein
MSGDLRRAQSLGNWTFAFLGPRGSSRNLINLGVPAGNVTEWEQTENGMRQASVMTSHATSSYYEGRARGVRASSTLFTDLSGVKQGDLKKLPADLPDVVVARERLRRATASLTASATATTN